MDLTEAEILRRGGKNTQKGKESESEVTQSCQTLCDPMDCSLPGSSVPGIFQAILPECIAISFSSGSSWPRDETQVSHIVDRCFTVWATREEYTELYKKDHDPDNQGGMIAHLKPEILECEIK